MGTKETISNIYNGADRHKSYTSHVGVVVEAIPTNIDKILDVGCGWGDVGSAIKNTNPVARAIGVDISMACLASARYNYFHVVEADATKLPFSDGMFDCVILSRVLHQVSTFSKALSEAKRVLHKTGTMIIFNQKACLENVKMDGPRARIEIAEPIWDELIDKNVLDFGLAVNDYSTPLHGTSLFVIGQSNGTRLQNPPQCGPLDGVNLKALVENYDADILANPLVECGFSGGDWAKTPTGPMYGRRQ